MRIGWHRDGPPARPVAAPLARCAELLDVDLAELGPAAATVEPYRRADGQPVWSLRLLERALHPERSRRRGAAV